MSTYKYALQRLSRDWDELKRDPIPTIFASPVNQNLLHWHANILAPTNDSQYKGIVIHVHIQFSNKYPEESPKVAIYSQLTHSHVFNASVCLDMLETHHSHESYYGWSSAYSLASILLQLQSFFFEEEHPSQQILKDIRASQHLTCKECTHNAVKRQFSPWTKEKRFEALPFADLDKRLAARFETISKTHSSNLPDVLVATSVTMLQQGATTSTMVPTSDASKSNQYVSPDSLLIILSFLDAITITKCKLVCKQWFKVSSHPSLWEKRELLCYHTKSSWEQDVIGIGFDVKLEHNKLSLHTPMDPLSYTAFYKLHVNKGVWKERINYWLPLYIHPSHAERAWSHFEQSIKEMYQHSSFDAKAAVGFLCTWMNQMVVDTMNGAVHASIKGLQGYMYAHRWLLAVVAKYPVADKFVKDNIKAFVQNSNNRTKKACPNIGEFLPMLTVSEEYHWKDVSNIVVEEVLARNSLWIVKQYAHLGNVPSQETNSNARNQNNKRPHQEEQEDPNDEWARKERISLSFDANKVSCKLIMFIVFFLTRFGEKSRQQAAHAYDVRYGKPTPQQETDLQAEVFRIQQASSYAQFFEYTLQKKIAEREIYDKLVQAMKRSLALQYHSQDFVQKQISIQRKSKRRY